MEIGLIYMILFLMQFMKFYSMHHLFRTLNCCEYKKTRLEDKIKLKRPPKPFFSRS